MTIHVAKHLLKQVEAALHAHEYPLHNFAFTLLQLFLQVGQDDPDELNDGNDEGTERKGSRVETEHVSEGRKKEGGREEKEEREKEKMRR